MPSTNFTIADLANKFAAKELSSREVTQTVLERLRATDAKIGAYLSVFKDAALADADRQDVLRSKGEADGALRGIPMAVKDNIAIEDLPCTCASRILENYRASYDATVITKLKKEGMVLLGKTNMDEFAMGASTETSAYQITRNPWNLDKVPGGSSGGSAAAVAAGSAIYALGSDTGGSIRQPAALCGIVGFKPTYGRISRHGLVAMASSLDVIGTLTTTVLDAALVFDAIQGVDPKDATTWPDFAEPTAPRLAKQETHGLTVGIPKEFFGEGLDPEVEKVVRAALDELQRLGFTLKEVSLPTLPHTLPVYYTVMPAEASTNLSRFDGMRYGLSLQDAKDLKDVYLKSRDAGFGIEVKRRIMMGTFALSAGYYDQYYVKAQKVRAKIKADFDRAFQDVDFLVSPTSPTVAFNIHERTEDPLSMYLSDVYTVSANLVGIPAISVPCGFAHDLPVGLQLMAKQCDETRLLGAAYAYEQATEWHTMRAPLL